MGVVCVELGNGLGLRKSGRYLNGLMCDEHATYSF